ncbi:MAG TPA: phosphotransferase [Streptosporangiaceae bacterium]
MNDAAVVGRVLREYHARGIDPAGLRRVGGSVASGIVTYLVSPDQAGRAPAGRSVMRWVVRACRADVPVPVHVGAAPPGTMLDWLMTRASTLDWLEARGYPAPRVIRTRSGDAVGMDGIWLTLATTFVDGPLIRSSLAQLRMLGAALGRLHALEVGVGVGGAAAGDAGTGGAGGADAGAGESGAGGAGAGPGEAGVPGHASWYPEDAIAATMARLDAVETLVPDYWQPLYQQCRSTARAVGQSLGGLPRGVVHGDAWPGHAVQSAPDAVTLIDWETSGLGLPVLDLGNCLIESLLDSQPSEVGSGARPGAWLVEPDEDRVAAVARGYAQGRVPGAAERAILPDAVRFGACYIGAIHLHQALAEGVSGASMDARLDRLRNRMDVSDAVARLAAPHLAGGAETVR